MLITLFKRPSLKATFPWIGIGVCIALLAANLLHDTLFHGRTSHASEAPAPAAPPEGGAASPATTVSLPEGKSKSAKIATEPARIVSLATEVGVPGRIEANPDRRVEIRPRASGVIRTVKAVLGQSVRRGETIVVLDSPDVGTARLNLRSKQRELATARFEADWKEQVAANVEALITELNKRVEAVILQKQYANRPLGAFRAQLLQAYAEFDIASHEEEKTAGLYERKIIGEHPAFVAKHTREGSQAKFEAALEQVRFDAQQQKRVANQMVRDAEGAVIDAAARLRILGVHEDVASLLARSTSQRTTAVDEDITAYEITAPFDGTIILKSPLAVASSKADVNDSLFTLAELSSVWVTANVPESEFAQLPALQNGTIRLTAAAYPGRMFEAHVLTIGSVVDQTTRTVSLMAETLNPGGALKLGMFVRIVLDTKATEDALTIPTSAVVEIEGRQGVFVPSGTDGRTYTFRPVKLGRVAGNRRVVLSGLTNGETVVSSGAFTLKSELILQNQTEDE